MKIRKILAGMGLAAILGCGNGYGINNDEPEQEDAVQAANGSYMPIDADADTENDGNLQIPCNVPEPRVPRGPFNPGNADNPTEMQGWGVYCIRKQTPGSTHFGFLTNYSLSDADGINEIGLVAYGDVTKQRFMQEYPGATQAAYQNSKRNFGNHGDEDALALYSIDNYGNETEFALNKLDCESLDKLLKLYGKGQ
ncbi:MAG: hypothetical protein WC852_04805 [Candidatus Nanoarchaeia archaeon]